MKWFFALNEMSKRFDDYAAMVKVAVYTAKTRTSLVPHCLYDGQPGPFTEWLEKNGVKVIRVRSRFADFMKEEAQKRNIPGIYPIGAGAFLRLELVALEGLFEPGERVLYTDCDVMFAKDPVPALKETQCEFFAAVPEAAQDEANYCNTGVMLMDVDSLKKTFDEFVARTWERIGSYVMKSWDQDAYNEYYEGRWKPLPYELNWRPYWGFNPAAVIVHFHGPKPMWRPDDIEQRPAGTLAIKGFPAYRAAWEKLLGEAVGDGIRAKNGSMKRNLIYHLYPLKDSIWRWHLSQMKAYLPCFNGSRFVVVARDQWTDHPNEVSTLIGKEAEVIVVDNDPEMKEERSLLPILERLESSNPMEATFFAHGKGVSLRDPVRLRATMALVRALWFLNVGCIDLVDSLISRFDCIGAFRKIISTEPGEETWRYAESFYWLAHSLIFSKSWRQYKHPDGTDAFPATYIPMARSFNLTENRPYSDLVHQVPPLEECEEWVADLVGVELHQEKSV